jgi:glycyl-tRNA synthetase
MLSIDEMYTFCKKKGFVYPNSEIYGGLAGFFDYGPLGVELKNNIKQSWWRTFVHNREDVVGIDGSIITNPKVWEASGHVGGFADILIECSKCKERFRADVLIEDVLKISADGMKELDIDKKITENKIRCPRCKGELGKASRFNLMFKTFVGPKETNESIAYLRPETAQLIFVNFRQVYDTSRLKLPFGIAQIGKAFRNEISPRNFLFRCREFEQMEIEYFIRPKQECPYIKEAENHKLLVYSAEMQEKSKEPKEMTIKDALKNKVIKSEWHGYWLATVHKWFIDLGAKPENFRIRQHRKDELAHYSTDCWDLEYNFPFGWKELEGIADRGDFDLQQHIKHSKKDLSIFDEETKQRIVPHVIAEPSLGVDRAFLVFMYDAYDDDKKRENVVLHLNPKLAPVKIAVFPLVSNREDLMNLAKEVYENLKEEYFCVFDKSGSIGRRYARNDEIGTPVTITVDEQSLKDKTVTARDRNTTEQVRIKIKDLREIMGKIINGESILRLGEKVSTRVK